MRAFFAIACLIGGVIALANPDSFSPWTAGLGIAAGTYNGLLWVVRDRVS